jgi:pyruvate/2-oxoglutarate dehydrogenase complex dihydrolipoamide dehydrogenase (E3) component
MTYDVAVVGGGTAGLTAALAAAHAGARTALIERRRRCGGDCTFTGCVPSKTLIEAARTAHESRLLLGKEVEIDFGRVMERVRRTVEQIAEDERDDRFTRHGIDVVHAAARFAGENELELDDGSPLRARRFVLATGTRPATLSIPGPYLTNETIFDLDRLPGHLVVLGGGPTGLELAQAFRRFGSAVTVIEAGERLLPREEPEVSQVVADALREEGVEIVLGTECMSRRGTEHTVLVAVGRKADVEGLGLERAGVELADGFVRIDERCRTSADHVYAAGDVTGGRLFTHVAAREGSVAGLNAAGRRAKLEERAVPEVTFLEPEVARVGLTEAEARDRHQGVRAAVFPMSRVDRARIAGRPAGFVKLVTARRRVLGRAGGGLLVGAHIVGPQAGELIQECVFAVATRAFAGRLAQTIHAYPTMSMAVQQAAAQLFPLGRTLAEREP